MTTQLLTFLCDDARADEVTLVGDDDDRFGRVALLADVEHELVCFLERAAVGDGEDDQVRVHLVVLPNVVLERQKPLQLTSRKPAKR